MRFLTDPPPARPTAEFAPLHVGPNRVSFCGLGGLGRYGVQHTARAADSVRRDRARRLGALREYRRSGQQNPVAELRVVGPFDCRARETRGLGSLLRRTSSAGRLLVAGTRRTLASRRRGSSRSAPPRIAIHRSVASPVSRVPALGIDASEHAGVAQLSRALTHHHSNRVQYRYLRTICASWMALKSALSSSQTRSTKVPSSGRPRNSVRMYCWMRSVSEVDSGFVR